MLRETSLNSSPNSHTSGPAGVIYNEGHSYMAPVALMMSLFALGHDRKRAGLPEVQRDRQAGHDDRGTALLRF